MERCLIYSPDALGVVAVRRCPPAFARVREIAPLSVELQSVLPTVTPVCFASMFTGMSPATHGIRKYEKPALPSITLFEALAACGHRVAIVSVPGSSIDTFFRGRPVEYHSEPYDAERLLPLYSWTHPHAFAPRCPGRRRFAPYSRHATRPLAGAAGSRQAIGKARIEAAGFAFYDPGSTSDKPPVRFS